MKVEVVAFGKNLWDVQTIHGFESSKNEEYRLIFYAKADGPGKKIQVQIQNNEKGVYIPKEIYITENWRKYEWLFYTQVDDMNLAIQFISLGVVELDNVVVEAEKGGKNKRGKKGSLFGK